MKVLFRLLIWCCAILYASVSSTIFWHEHAHAEEQYCSHHHAEDGHSHHDAKTCSICFFIHTGNIVLPNAVQQPEITQRDILPIWNDHIYISYELLFSKLKSNKDPPLLSDIRLWTA